MESHLSDVDESTETHNDITTTTEKATASVAITSIATPTEPIGKQAPVTTTNEASFVEKTPNATMTRHEVVTKTVTVNVVQEKDTTTQQAMNADIVFIINHNYSMDNKILVVKNNITTFVNDLSKR